MGVGDHRFETNQHIAIARTENALADYASSINIGLRVVLLFVEDAREIKVHLHIQ
jgi:hypothetical protein